jgi:hypothetical protein
MRASDTCNEIQRKISELLIGYDCEWKSELLREDEESGSKFYTFTTMVAGSHIQVNERSVVVSKEKPLKEGEEGIFTESRKIESQNKISNLYKHLVRRFKEDQDISFYNEVYESITDLIEQEKIDKETNKDRSNDGRHTTIFNS